MEKTITISINEYKELLAKAERIATVKRVVGQNEYLCTKDILAVLNIDNEGENENA